MRQPLGPPSKKRKKARGAKQKMSGGGASASDVPGYHSGAAASADGAPVAGPVAAPASLATAGPRRSLADKLQTGA